MGRSPRSRRRIIPIGRDSRSTANRFATSASSPAAASDSVAPAGGSSCPMTASAAIRTMNDGHSQAPARRQRIRTRRAPACDSGAPSMRPRLRRRAVFRRTLEQGAAVRRRRKISINSTAPNRSLAGDPGGLSQRGLEAEIPLRPQEKGKTGEMATETAEPAADGAAAVDHLTTEDRIWLLRAMLLMRGLEERAMTLYRQGKVPGSFYDGYGQEAVSAGAAFAMGPEDRLCILHRDLAAHLIRGVSPARILAQYMGRATGITGGRDGNVHFGDRNLGCVGMVSMLPDMMLVAAGMAMAFKLRGERRCALTWFGDGSTSRGDFHEAMNWAGVQKLPVIFVLENNQYAYSTPVDKQYAIDPVERAAAYGFVGVTVDGNDVEAMFETTRVARERALNGDGPTLIEALTMRMHGHAAHDDMKYVPKEQVEEWRKRDPIERQEARLGSLGVDVDALRAEVKATIDAAAEDALAAPMPDPAAGLDGVFSEGEAEPLGDGQAPWSGFSAGVA